MLSYITNNRYAHANDFKARSGTLYLRESALYSGVVTSLFVKRMALGRDPDAPTNSAALPSAEATAVTNEGI